MFRVFPPHPSLAHLVRAYGVLDDVHTELTAEHRLYPECTVLLAFLQGESYLGVGNDLKRLPALYVQEFRDFPVRLRSCGRTGWSRSSFILGEPSACWAHRGATPSIPALFLRR